MSTKKQWEANKKNALASTGPRTPEGKAAVARNAVKHGLTGVSPVIVGLECEEDWQDFRARILADLDPQGCLEETLAERVAFHYWRLQRVARYETEVININQEKVEETFKGLQENLKEATKKRDLARGRVESANRMLAFLRLLTTLSDNEKVEGADAYNLFETASMATDGLPWPSQDFAKTMELPPEAHKDTWAWTGWTAGLVRQVLSALASKVTLTMEDLLALCLKYQTEFRQQQEKWGQENQDLRDDLQRHRYEKESQLRRRRMLPSDKESAKIARYEGHIGRQLSQALHALERVQERRRGGNVPPPMVMDVTIDRSDSAMD